MIRSVAKRRIAVLAYASEEREYARRVLRSLGYAPLVFTNLDELRAMGADATTFDMLYPGNMPVTDSKGREVLEGVLVSIGPDVPVLHAGSYRDVRAKLHGVVAGPPRSFSDFYKLILSFLSARGFESTRFEACRSVQHSADIDLHHAALFHAQFGVRRERKFPIPPRWKCGGWAHRQCYFCRPERETGRYRV